MSNKQKQLSLNCFLDLQRTATNLYLNPRGKTHQIFLAHAQKNLSESQNKKLAKILKSETDYQLLADKILTFGILLKPEI